MPALAISSTECRVRAHKGEPVWYLVPDGVVQYIAKRGLYQSKPGTLNVSTVGSPDSAAENSDAPTTSRSDTA